MLALKSIESLDATDIDTLFAGDGVAEHLHLEYKELATDKETGDILQELTAMANTDGGDIVLGIKEKRGEGIQTSRPAAISDVGNLDELTQRLNNALHERVSPRLVGVRMKSVKTNDGTVMVVRATRSYIGPHIVRKEGAFTCHYRNEYGKQPMDAHQLRRAFVQGEVAHEKIRDHFKARYGAFCDTGVAEPGLLLQVQPLLGYLGDFSPDFAKIFSFIAPFVPHQLDRIERFFVGTDRFSYNLDGVGGKWNETCYCQFFRNGGIEVAVPRVMDDHAGKIRSFQRFVPIWVLAVLDDCVEALRLWGCSGPLYVSLGFRNVQGLTITGQYGLEIPMSKKLERSNISLPEFEFDVQTASPDDVRGLVRRAFDVLGQGMGFPEFPIPN